MSLVDSYKTELCKVIPTRVADGEGGFTTTWQDDTQTFLGAITLTSSSETRVGEQQTIADTYQITTSRDITLQGFDVVKRLADGLILRVTQNSEDNKTPACAGLDMRAVTAERWELP